MERCGHAHPCQVPRHCRGVAESLKIRGISQVLGSWGNPGLSGDSGAASALTAFSQQCLLVWRTVVISHFSPMYASEPRAFSLMTWQSC